MSNYLNFIYFVEAYYKFLEQTTYPSEVLQNARLYADSETTLVTANVNLVESFFKNYGYELPRDLIVNEPSFIKRFRDIYKTKGSEQAAKLLFRVLYNIDIDFKYPSERIFKPSDGNWVKFKTLKVSSLNSANIFDFKNTRITGSISKATAKVADVLKLQINSLYFSDNHVYELYLEDVKGSFLKETITSSYSSAGSATTNYQLGSVKIVDGGKGYTLYNNVFHEGSVLKISKVDDEGTIKLIDVVDSGAYILLGTSNATQTSSFIVTTDNPSKAVSGNVVVINDLGTFTSDIHHGLKRKDSLNLQYFGNTNSILNQTRSSVSILKVIDDKRFLFSTTGVGNTSLSANLIYTSYANLYATFDILKTTNGFYIKEKGQPSSSYVIQGQLPNTPDTSILYYQPYSYVISSSKSVDKWRDIVRSTIHPSGTELFGDVLIENKNNSKLLTTGKSEIHDYLSLTADNFKSEFSADSVSITFSTSRPRNFRKNTRPKKVVIFGDSVSTYGGLILPSGSDPTQESSYLFSQNGSILNTIRALYPSYNVINISRGGMTTDEALTGVKNYVSSSLPNPFGSSVTITQWIIDNSPDKIILRYGLADAVLINNSTTTLNNIQTIINFAISRGIEVILIGVNPTANFGTAEHCGYINAISSASNTTAGLINSGILSKAVSQSLKFANARAVTPYSCSLPDGIHPFETFGITITDEILRQLRAQVPASEQITLTPGITVPITSDHVNIIFGYL